MKKIYMPNEEQLREMQDLGANVHKYITAKVIEALVVRAKNKPYVDVNAMEHELAFSDADIRENYDIVHGYCLLYPVAIGSVEYAQYDLRLCQKLLDKSSDKSIYNLDVLNQFASSIQFNIYTIKETLAMLKKGLLLHPEYRFEYNEGALLNSIFSCQGLPFFANLSENDIRALIAIEPAYAIMLEDHVLGDNTAKNMLIEGISEYGERYDIELSNTILPADGDMLSRPKVKRLINEINKNPNNLYETVTWK